ncbi:hypothetical protein [Pseudoxanthomonas sp. SE1]|uniref:hypothetical protein n=1 Tax=Pseudoxanthomonas sp. SE1 TaxID=1664560 RepID=UPI00240D2B4D|nr:hypothetical protein [Pseudoxanthomonas sp. SE1]WFC43251.1 hypothetical protein OY559_06995 [Pseudoxanthomonas sp. SE1]
MSILGTAAVKPFAIALAIAGALLLASNGGWWAYAATLKASASSARAAVTTVTTERDAWKGRAGELKAANVAYDSAFADLAGELKAAQAENLRLQRDGAAAIAAAEAAQADADRTLSAFMDRYAAQIRAPDCASAMASVARFCPALEGY